MTTKPDFSFEAAAQARGLQLIAGVDEVGRGPLCGPVTAAAVVFTGPIPEGLNDSKKLSAKRRGALVEAIKASADWCVAHASVEEIDALNIYHASHLAMCRAVAGLPRRPDHVLVDGNRVPKDIGISAEPIVKGDGKSLSIAAASILAKVERDAQMLTLDAQFPGYGFARHKGYPTPEHFEALQRLGPCAAHRRGFAPVRRLVEPELF